jgi:hypothetical protein
MFGQHVAKFARAEHALKFAQNVIQFKDEGTVLLKQGEFSRALAAYQTALGSHPCRETAVYLNEQIRQLDEKLKEQNSTSGTTGKEVHLLIIVLVMDEICTISVFPKKKLRFRAIVAHPPTKTATTTKWMLSSRRRLLPRRVTARRHRRQPALPGLLHLYGLEKTIIWTCLRNIFLHWLVVRLGV